MGYMRRAISEKRFRAPLAIFELEGTALIYYCACAELNLLGHKFTSVLFPSRLNTWILDPTTYEQRISYWQLCTMLLVPNVIMALAVNNI